MKLFERGRSCGLWMWHSSANRFFSGTDLCLCRGDQCSSISSSPVLSQRPSLLSSSLDQSPCHFSLQCPSQRFLQGNEGCGRTKPCSFSSFILPLFTPLSYHFAPRPLKTGCIPSSRAAQVFFYRWFFELFARKCWTWKQKEKCTSNKIHFHTIGTDLEENRSLINAFVS